MLCCHTWRNPHGEAYGRQHLRCLQPCRMICYDHRNIVTSLRRSTMRLCSARRKCDSVPTVAKRVQYVLLCFRLNCMAYSVFALFKTFENFDVPRRHNLVMVITLCRQCLVFPEKKSANQSLSQASFEKQKSGLNLCTHL